MKKIKLIYNPNSGDKAFKDNLDIVISRFQKGGFEIHPFRTMSLGDIHEHIMGLEKNIYSAILVSGGDGTVNIVINSIMKAGLNHIPLGIIPSGTANDFASFLKLPKNLDNICERILKMKFKNIDLGIANDKYFINVCAGGLFSNISTVVNPKIKGSLGKLAYYLKGIEQLHGFKPIPVKITNSKEIIEEEIYLFLVLNSSGTGGVRRLSPTASISDGFFDFIALKGVPLLELSPIVLKILKGEHLKDDRVIFFRDNYIKIESMSNGEDLLETDVDGEVGRSLPIEIKNIHNAIKIIY